jgi:ELWxxDGT repeat protein
MTRSRLNRHVRNRRLFLESLEDRRVMTTYSSLPQDYTIVGDAAYFAANDGLHGFAIWKTDGSGAGTTLVKDFEGANLYAQSSDLRDLTNVGGTLFFTRDAGSPGSEELWKSDGTASGTELLQTLQNASEFVNVNGTLYFAASDAAHGNELWKSDGTASGTGLLKDVIPGAESGRPTELVDLEGTLFFAPQNTSQVRELWKSDGTENGTILVTQFGTDAQANGIFTLTATSDELFAVQANNDGAFALYGIDGASSAATLLGTFPRQPLEITEVGDATYFGVNAVSGAENGAQLWKTDGSAAGTSLVRLFERDDRDSRFGDFVNLNGTLIFVTNFSSRDVLIWTSNGTSAGTTRMTGFSNTAFPPLTNLNGTLYFTVESAYEKVGLWRSNGTTSGTRIVENFHPNIMHNA